MQRERSPKGSHRYVDVPTTLKLQCAVACAYMAIENRRSRGHEDASPNGKSNRSGPSRRRRDLVSGRILFPG
jgi:hypothetical protein